MRGLFPVRPTVLLMNQAGMHASASVGQHRQRWKEQGLVIASLPSYSPELNWVEGQRRKLKYHTLPDRHHASRADLRRAVQAATSGAPPHDLLPSREPLPCRARSAKRLKGRTS
ncbi:transposase [Deinococcus hopiensis]|uniref:transposase n=1 Tax=Deinococcus hopiensis TaxID=309885 RepID=UPI000A062D85